MRAYPIVLVACILALASPPVTAHPVDALVDPVSDDDPSIDLELDLGLDSTDDPAPPATRVLPDVHVVVVSPPIERVLRAAYRAAALDGNPAGSWTWRARLTGLVPAVSARTARNTRWHIDDPDIAHGTTIELRATWRLDRLVFDGRELQAAAVDAARRRERRRLAQRVIALYFEWRRAAAMATTNARYLPRAEEAAAQLDALTDGAFSEQVALARSVRSLSGRRTAER